MWPNEKKISQYPILKVGEPSATPGPSPALYGAFSCFLGVALFAKSCIVYNPLVYFLAVQRFRKDVINVVLDCCGIKNQINELDTTAQTNIPDQSLIMLETKTQPNTSRVIHIPLRTSHTVGEAREIKGSGLEEETPQCSNDPNHAGTNETLLLGNHVPEKPVIISSIRKLSH